MNESDIILALEQRWVTREELRDMLGLSNDRAVRAYVERLNKRLLSYNKCVLSTSRRSGYHIPNAHNPEDMKEVRLTLKELESKAISIFARRKVLSEFEKIAVSAEAARDTTQLSLF